MPRQTLLGIAGLLTVVSLWAAPGQPPMDVPRAHDPRLVVEPFAAAPDIVHPISMDFDSKGRLLVIESHTHFRPPNYKGPPHDRIRVVEDTDGDGKADRFTTFFEGTRATMDIAAHPDGSVYLATRNEILRLRDTDGDGKADERRRIVFLDTKGDYPHNGLAGLAFDTRGNLFFGMGENLGSTYKLVGSDGKTIQGEGDGGHVFWCDAEGRGLRRVATGFWNPFSTCRDIFGRLFTVDNDPDSMPPCRMLHVVEGGDYGFQFRYGRSGRHPFQAWDGQLPGTLPMVTGVGEAPCEIVSYESDGLPREYLGQLFVASWADHRVERYEPKERGASYVAERKPFIQGGNDFRPVGIAVAPDGSLFVSDWVRSDYNLHGKGAIWHVRAKESRKGDRPTDPRQAVFSAHRPLREAAATRLAATDEGRDFLCGQLGTKGPRTRAACLTALLDAGDRKFDLAAIAEKDAVVPIRAMAVRGLVARGEDASRFLESGQPAAVRLEAISSLKSKSDVSRLLQLLTDPDPFLRNAAVQRLAHSPELLTIEQATAPADPRQRIGLLLAWRASGQPEGVRRVRGFLADSNEDVRFLAAKWVADEKLSDYRPEIVKALEDRALNVRMYLAYATALARLDGRDVSEARMADYFLARLADGKVPASTRARMLQLVPSSHPGLKLDLLRDLLKSSGDVLKREAARALSEHPSAGRIALLREALADGDDQVRAQAVVGLCEHATARDELLALARKDNAALRDEALRGLVDSPLTPEQRAALQECAKQHADAAPLAARALGQPFSTGRPAASALDDWMKRLEGPADAAVGRRVFFHPKLAGCFRCHRAEGRGKDIGPDLSSVGRNPRRHILESILQPSNLIAPHFQAWRIETADGKVRTGMLVHTHLDVYTYLDEKGDLFKVTTTNIVESQPVPKSIMPDGLVDRMTDQEFRDLLAYLESLR